MMMSRNISLSTFLYSLLVVVLAATKVTSLLVERSDILALDQSETKTAAATPAIRGLQTTSQINVFVNGACLFVSRLLPGDILCECAVSTVFTFECAFQSQFCFGPDQSGYCSTPTLEGQIRFLQLSAGFTFCLNDATNGGDPRSGICFNIGGVLDGTDIIPFSVAADEADQQSVTTSTNKDTIVSKAVTVVRSKFASVFKSLRRTPKTQPPQQQQDQEATLLSCVGTSSNDNDNQVQCNSCQLCNNNTGYIFDCTNIDSIYIQSTCTPLSMFTNLHDPNQKIQFFPQFDGKE